MKTAEYITALGCGNESYGHSLGLATMIVRNSRSAVKVLPCAGILPSLYCLLVEQLNEYGKFGSRKQKRAWKKSC